MSDTWTAVQRTVASSGCHCALRAGMTRAELRELNAGCKDPWFICPALDAYRRRLGYGVEPAPTKPPRYDPFASQVRRTT